MTGTEGSATPGADVVDGAVVDVAIPVYRRATFLAEAIESVLGQTYERWQLRICDNGPGGGEIEEVARSYLGDSRISYHATGEELSLPENWTRAIQHGNAPFVGLLNDDDRWHPTFLRARVDALQAHPECAFAFGEVVQIEGDGREVLRTPARFPEGTLSREVLAHWLVQECLVSVPTVLVRRSAYEAVGGRFTDMLYLDWDLWVRLAARSPAYYVARNDSDLRRHPTTYSVQHAERPERLIQMADSFEEAMRDALPGFGITRLDRARYRSKILMRAAETIHLGGGWRSSGSLYLRSLRSYPPTLFYYGSLRMIARTVLPARVTLAGGTLLRKMRRELARPGARGSS